MGRRELQYERRAAMPKRNKRTPASEDIPRWEDTEPLNEDIPKWEDTEPLGYDFVSGIKKGLSKSRKRLDDYLTPDIPEGLSTEETKDFLLSSIDKQQTGLKDEMKQNIKDAPRMATQAASSLAFGYPERIPAIKEYVSELPDEKRAAAQAAGYGVQGALLAPRMAPLYGMAKTLPLSLRVGPKITSALQAIGSIGVSTGVGAGTAALQAHGEERDVAEAGKTGAILTGVLSTLGTLINAGARGVANRYFNKAAGKTDMGIDTFSDITTKEAPTLKKLAKETKVTMDGRIRPLDKAERKAFIQDDMIDRVNQKYEQLRQKFEGQFDEYANNLGLTKNNKVVVPDSKKKLSSLIENIEKNTGAVIPRAIPEQIKKHTSQISRLTDKINAAQDFSKQLRRKGATHVMRGKTAIPIKSDKQELLNKAKDSMAEWRKEVSTLRSSVKKLKEHPDVVWSGGKELKPIANETITDLKALSAGDTDLTVAELLNVRNKLNAVGSGLRAKVEGKLIGPKGHRPFLRSLDEANDYIKSTLYDMYPEEGLRNLDFSRFSNFRKTVEEISDKAGGGAGYSKIKELAKNPTSGQAKTLREFMDPAREMKINEIVSRVGPENRKLISDMLDNPKVWDDSFIKLPEYYDVVENMGDFYSKSPGAWGSAKEAGKRIDVSVGGVMEIPEAVKDMLFSIGGREGKLLKNPRFLSSLMSKEHMNRIYPITKMVTGPAKEMAFKRLITEIAIKEGLMDEVKDMWRGGPKTLEEGLGAADKKIQKGLGSLDELWGFN